MVNYESLALRLFTSRNPVPRAVFLSTVEYRQAHGNAWAPLAPWEWDAVIDRLVASGRLIESGKMLSLPPVKPKPKQMDLFG